MATAEQIPSSSQPATITPSRPGQRTYTCPECGHTLRVFGRGRHQLYFPDEDASLGDPVMDGVCPDCGRALPGK